MQLPIGKLPGNRILVLRIWAKRYRDCVQRLDLKKLESQPVLGGYLGASVQQKKPIPERHRNRTDVWREAEMSHPSPRELEIRSSYLSPQGLSHSQQPFSWCSPVFCILRCPEAFKYPSPLFIWDNLDSLLAKSLQIQLWSRSNQFPFSPKHPFIISSKSLREYHWRSDSTWCVVKDGPVGWDFRRSNDSLVPEL